MPKHPGVPVDLSNPKAWMRRAADVMNGLMLGKSNNVRALTLTASSTTTTITDREISPDTIAILVPVNASGLTAALAGVRQSAAPGVITLTHASSAAADQNFRVALVG